MKKLLVSLVSCLLTGAVYAQSTCEIRVDAHPNATTNQRVAYCLTPEFNAPDTTYSGLVFSGVSTHQPHVTQPTQERPTAKRRNFKSEKMAVSRGYVPTVQFPEVMPGEAIQVVETYAVPVSYITVPSTTETETYIYDNSASVPPTVVPATTGTETYIHDNSASVPPTVVPATTGTGTYIYNNPAPIAQDYFVYVESPTVPAYGSVPAKTTTQPNTLQTTQRSAADNNSATSQRPTYETKTGTKARQSKANRRLVTTTVSTPVEEPAPASSVTNSGNLLPADNTNPYLQEDFTQTYTQDTLSDNTYTEIPVDASKPTTSN